MRDFSVHFPVLKPTNVLNISRCAIAQGINDTHNRNVIDDISYQYAHSDRKLAVWQLLTIKTVRSRKIWCSSTFYGICYAGESGRLGVRIQGQLPFVYSRTTKALSRSQFLEIPQFLTL